MLLVNVDKALLQVINVPDDVEVNATALLTRVDFGVASAVNSRYTPCRFD